MERFWRDPTWLRSVGLGIGIGLIAFALTGSGRSFELILGIVVLIVSLAAIVVAKLTA